jgi:hypothetical protein
MVLMYFFNQVRHLDTSDKSELHKLQQLKDEQGLIPVLFCCVATVQFFLGMQCTSILSVLKLIFYFCR